jgi:hypothetical protein
VYRISPKVIVLYVKNNQSFFVTNVLTGRVVLAGIVTNLQVGRPRNFGYFSGEGKGKDKGKFHPITGHEDSEGE